MRRLGTGIGWRPEIADTVERMPGVDWVEVVAENVCPGHLPPSLLRLRERGVTVIPHGVSLGLGGADRPDEGRLTALAERAEALGSPLATEHIAFVRAGGPLTASPRLEAGHLLPVPRTRDALDVLCENVRIAQDALPVPLALENVAALFSWPGEELTEGQFLSELVERTGVRLLIDVANLHTNHVNRGEDPAEALAALPVEAIAYVHVAGGFERDGVWHDSHAHAVPRPVIDILTDLASHTEPPGVLLERDENFPEPAELEQELKLIGDAVAAGRERADGGAGAGAGSAGGAARTGAGPANGATGAGADPANRATGAGAGPAGGATGAGADPANGGASAGADPASRATGAGASPANRATGAGADPAEEAARAGADPANGGASSDASPASRATGAGAGPAEEAARAGADPANGAASAGADPAGEAASTDASPAGEAARAGASPANGAASSDASPANGAASSDASPARGAASAGAGPAGGGVAGAARADAGVRERLGVAQAAVLSSLVAGTPVPEGFDRVRMGVQARALAAKRADVVAKVAPELPVILGERYRVAFLEYARERPMGAGYRRDALDFAGHLLRAGSPQDTAARRELREWWLDRAGPAPRSEARMARAVRRVLLRRG
ncbi:hypothetical protein BFF78_10930 [Streptomyces fodineus]|uniref:SCO6045-like C-terminal domain-containing protein n=1 Tax=Streptomyces fodineus TaxID=1904616 RepID=A0A1D7Y804_9ACTN|nr:DUF692 family multinuclear iron-containing protein [Streptomyces fodineus]AOR31489.1 hypothetical protein BFF78_10930 [Streptomyces fodineus]